MKVFEFTPNKPIWYVYCNSIDEFGDIESNVCAMYTNRRSAEWRAAKIDNAMVGYGTFNASGDIVEKEID